MLVGKARGERKNQINQRESREQSNSCLGACREEKTQHKDGLGQEGPQHGDGSQPWVPKSPKPAEKGQIWAPIQQLRPRAVSLPCLGVNKPKYCSSCSHKFSKAQAGRAAQRQSYFTR